jgi:hypothetical protein
MKSKRKIILVSILLCFFIINFSQAALVKCGTSQNQATQQSQTCTLSNLFQEVFLIISFLIGSATLLAIGYVLYGSIRMILARGNPQAIQYAKSTMINAITGLIIVLLAYLIVDYALSFLTGRTFSLTAIPNILSNLR